MGKEKINDGPQTLKQAKAAFKARGSTAVSAIERRQLERGAVLLERADRIKEQEQRRKDLSKKKVDKEAKVLKSCVAPSLLGTQRRLDRFGHKSSQFHLGAFLKPKPRPLATIAEDKTASSREPWEDDDVDDDTLLDLAAESPVATAKAPAGIHSQPTPRRAQTTPSKKEKVLFPTADDVANWDDLLARSSQLARELAIDQKSTSPVACHPSSFARIPSFNSADFDLSVDDLEELDLPVKVVQSQSKAPESPSPDQPSGLASDSASQNNVPNVQQKGRADEGKNMDRKLMPPPPLKIPAKHHPSPVRSESSTNTSFVRVPHGISLADLESLAGEDILLSQFDGT